MRKIVRSDVTMVFCSDVVVCLSLRLNKLQINLKLICIF